MTPHTHDYEFSPLPPGALALRVPDVAEAKTKLEAAGVRDPSGNPILLHHRYAAYPDGGQP